MRKIKYRLLIRSVSAFAVLTALFSGILIAHSFETGLRRERAHAAETLSACIKGVQSAYAAYAIQGASPEAQAIQRAAEQYEPSAKVTRGNASIAAIRLQGRTLIAEAGFTIGGEPCTLSIKRSVDEVYRSREAMLLAYRILYLLFLPIGIIMMYGAGRSITRPVEALTRAANALSAGDLTVRCPVQRQDEIGNLADAFNRMADSVLSEIEKREMLIGSLSHEMKTPLQAIIGHADLMYMGKTDEEARLTALKTILHEASRLNRLSVRMLEWMDARNTEKASLQRASLSAIFENVQSAFEPRARLKISSPEDAFAFADAPLLEALLSNLTDNALNAGASEIILSAERQENEWLLRVSDNGAGMSAESLAHAEEPFYREDKARSRAHGGAGLGLALCAEIARAHGTALAYESEKGRGTTVSLRLREAADE